MMICDKTKDMPIDSQVLYWKERYIAKRDMLDILESNLHGYKILQESHIQYVSEIRKFVMDTFRCVDRETDLPVCKYCGVFLFRHYMRDRRYSDGTYHYADCIVIKTDRAKDFEDHMTRGITK